MAPYHGECLCGDVKITIKNEPQGSCVCFCKDCAKLSSGPGGACIVVKEEDIETKGKMSTYVTTKVVSGKPKTFYVCSHCFTGIMGNAEGQPDIVTVKLGLFSTEDQLKLFPQGGFMDDSKTAYTKKLSEFLGKQITA
ncbi:hypothetical protein TRVA0_009S02036 [Trichomonascus vanleenenianus]|uniref:GFA family protein n=1 Tax=Trichomonascus vanleenenianus TaxID=2268995 RepID=UPI003EC9876E